MDEMTYMQISCYATPNSTDRKHVDEIAQSILQHGWDGAPIRWLPCSISPTTPTWTSTT